MHLILKNIKCSEIGENLRKQIKKNDDNNFVETGIIDFEKCLEIQPESIPLPLFSSEESHLLCEKYKKINNSYEGDLLKKYIDLLLKDFDGLKLKSLWEKIKKEKDYKNTKINQNTDFNDIFIFYLYFFDNKNTERMKLISTCIYEKMKEKIPGFPSLKNTKNLKRRIRDFGHLSQFCKTELKFISEKLKELKISEERFNLFVLKIRQMDQQKIKDICYIVQEFSIDSRNPKKNLIYIKKLMEYFYINSPIETHFLIEFLSLDELPKRMKLFIIDVFPKLSKKNKKKLYEYITRIWESENEYPFFYCENLFLLLLNPTNNFQSNLLTLLNSESKKNLLDRIDINVIEIVQNLNLSQRRNFLELLKKMNDSDSRRDLTIILKGQKKNIQNEIINKLTELKESNLKNQISFLGSLPQKNDIEILFSTQNSNYENLMNQIGEIDIFSMEVIKNYIINDLNSVNIPPQTRKEKLENIGFFIKKKYFENKDNLMELSKQEDTYFSLERKIKLDDTSCFIYLFPQEKKTQLDKYSQENTDQADSRKTISKKSFEGFYQEKTTLIAQINKKISFLGREDIEEYWNDMKRKDLTDVLYILSGFENKEKSEFVSCIEKYYNKEDFFTNSCLIKILSETPLIERTVLMNNLFEISQLHIDFRDIITLFNYLLLNNEPQIRNKIITNILENKSEISYINDMLAELMLTLRDNYNKIHFYQKFDEYLEKNYSKSLTETLVNFKLNNPSLEPHCKEHKTLNDKISKIKEKLNIVDIKDPPAKTEHINNLKKIIINMEGNLEEQNFILDELLKISEREGQTEEFLSINRNEHSPILDSNQGIDKIKKEVIQNPDLFISNKNEGINLFPLNHAEKDINFNIKSEKIPSIEKSIMMLNEFNLDKEKISAKINSYKNLSESEMPRYFFLYLSRN